MIKKISLIFVCSYLSACAIAVPIINGFQELGVTPASRREALAKDLRQFNNLLASNSAQRAAGYFEPDIRTQFLRELANPDVKIVDGKSLFVDFSEDSKEAKVEYSIRSYKVPFYVVQDKIKILTWKYTSGWKIHEIEDAPAS